MWRARERKGLHGALYEAGQGLREKMLSGERPC